MSPFAAALRDLRFKKGLRQYEVADRVGCERSYISSIETDLKQAPPAAFLDRLCRQLGLSNEERNELVRARLKSRRNYSVPSDVSSETYEFVHELFERIEQLSRPQLQALCAVLQLGAGPVAQAMPSEGRIRRSDRRDPAKEAPM